MTGGVVRKNCPPLNAGTDGALTPLFPLLSLSLSRSLSRSLARALSLARSLALSAALNYHPIYADVRNSDNSFASYSFRRAYTWHLWRGTETHQHRCRDGGGPRRASGRRAYVRYVMSHSDDP